MVLVHIAHYINDYGWGCAHCGNSDGRGGGAAIVLPAD